MIIIIKDESLRQKAESLFESTGVTITSSGERHIGAVVGTKEFREEYVRQKVKKWVTDVEKLAKIATDEPQIAYAAYTKGICHRWGFLQRTVKGVGHLYAPLESAIATKLIPAIVGRQVSQLEREIFELPVRFGGMGIPNPQKQADKEYENSVFVTKDLAEQIYNQDQSAEADMEIIKFRIQNTEYKIIMPFFGHLK